MNPPTPQTRADQLEERLIDFAVRVVKLSGSLPKNAAGKHIAARFFVQEHRLRRITARREAPKATATLFTSFASSSKN